MKYFVITQESPAYKTCENLWSYTENWNKANDEIKNLIGCDTNNNLVYNELRLCLLDVPKNIENQFCKKSWYDGKVSPAKKNSEIQKKFKSISEKYHLKHYSATDIAEILGTLLQSGKESYYPPINGVYYMKTERNIKEHKGLIKIEEPDFLRLYADWLEKKESDVT